MTIIAITESEHQRIKELRDEINRLQNQLINFSNGYAVCAQERRINQLADELEKILIEKGLIEPWPWK